MKNKIYFKYPDEIKEIILKTGEVGNEISVTLKIAKWGLVDRGIGFYEFWGFKGRDVRIETEIQDIEVLEFDGSNHPELLPKVKDYLISEFDFIAEF